MARGSSGADADDGADNGAAVHTATQDTPYARAAEELRRLASRASTAETGTEFAVLARMYDKLAHSHRRLESAVSGTRPALGSSLRDQRRAARPNRPPASDA